MVELCTLLASPGEKRKKKKYFSLSFLLICCPDKTPYCFYHIFYKNVNGRAVFRTMTSKRELQYIRAAMFYRQTDNKRI